MLSFLIVSAKAQSLMVGDANSDNNVDISDVVFVVNSILTDESYLASCDVNHDGAVNVTDVTLLVNYLLGYPQPIFFIENADVNEDHDINITDVTSLVNLVLNAQTPTQGF